MECPNPNVIRTSPELKRILDSLDEGHVVIGIVPSERYGNYVLVESFRSKLCGHIPSSVESYYSFGEERIRVTITEFPNVKEARSALLSASSWFFSPMVKNATVSKETGDAMLRNDRMIMFVRHNVTVQISSMNAQDLHTDTAKEIDSQIMG